MKIKELTMALEVSQERLDGMTVMLDCVNQEYLSQLNLHAALKEKLARENTKIDIETENSVYPTLCDQFLKLGITISRSKIKNRPTICLPATDTPYTQIMLKVVGGKINVYGITLLNKAAGDQVENLPIPVFSGLQISEQNVAKIVAKIYKRESTASVKRERKTKAKVMVED